MPTLRSCYFCGTTDDVQEYAVVPPRFLDDEADQLSAALCETCKEKLLRVIDPLTDRLDERAGTTRTSRADDPATQTTSSAGDSPSTTADDDGVVMDSGRADAAAGDVGTESPVGEAAADASDEESPPPNYRKAMRLLSNREFPMERYDVEELLGGAYDMEEEEIAAVLAYAAESGRLEEENGTLRRA